MTPARNDLLTRETDTRSFPDKYANTSSRQSRLRLSAETILVRGKLWRRRLGTVSEDLWPGSGVTSPRDYVFRLMAGHTAADPGQY